jgi:uncharacterized protein with FMN-binding domain
VRRITLWLSATVAIVVLLFSYHTSTNSRTVAAGQPPAQAPGVVGAQPPPRAGGNGKPSPSSAATDSAAASVVNGTVAQTQWGPVQVQVRIANHRITDVKALVFPSGSGHDQAINSYALPRLRQEVLSAQSARIDGVSGATVTSDGYRESLQAALDAAHFGG